VLGLRDGSTESTRVVRSLLSDLIERGLDADRARLWVIADREPQRLDRALHAQDGQMTLRWVASALSDAKGRFRKLRGHRDMKQLMAAFDRRINAKCDPKKKPRRSGA
jgi:hypothetical protein